MAKPTRTARQLQALLQERIDAIPDLRGQLTDIQAGGIQWVTAGPGQANWTARVSNQGACRGDIARIISELQEEFDLVRD